MEFINLGSMMGALIITAVLMVNHYLSPLVGKIPGLSPRRLRSFAGGVAVAYVFLHMLPELVEGNQAIGEVLKQNVTLTPLLDLGIFLLALVGFCVYYGLEILAANSAQKGGQPSAGVYHLHLFMYCLYNFSITYTMPLRVQTGLFYAIIFTVAMSLHFILTDRSLNRNFHDRFSQNGRLALLGSLGAGWLVTALTDPINVVLVSLMVAFLSGSILYNVFREELPADRGSSYPHFLLGLAITTALLVLEAIVTASKHGA